MLVNDDRHRVSSEVLTLDLEVGRPLGRAEREALEHLLRACRDRMSAADSRDLASAFDSALDALGGEENICAG